jgi:hypothetical protein
MSLMFVGVKTYDFQLCSYEKEKEIMHAEFYSSI